MRRSPIKDRLDGLEDSQEFFYHQLAQLKARVEQIERHSPILTSDPLAALRVLGVTKPQERRRQ